MYADTIARLLELSPSGLTNDQLLWRVRRSGLRLSSAEIVQSLAMLADTGVARVSESGRWCLMQFPAPAPVTDRSPIQSQSRNPAAFLRAVNGVVLPRRSGEPAVPDRREATDASGPRADADWRRLLAYYAATQRLDPRGAVDERADRHGLSWQLFRAEGRWWGAGALRFEADRLPSELREALIRRPAGECSLGYPVSLFDEPGGTSFVPALLVPAAYTLNGATFIIEITTPEPALNPRWLDAALRRLQRWQKDSFIEALFPEGEEASFAEIVLRLANAVATLGGAALKPAQLLGELRVEGEGVRNVAGLFLPTGARFTQGAERDLEAVRQWPDETLRQTALWPLLCPADRPGDAAESGTATELPPVGLRPLTDRQYAAAVSALDGPLTLMQGPPGTGKSEVILSLLASIVLAGGTAVVVSRNHRALDEVEERLVRIAGEAPLLTRARDSDGQRDASLLSEMRLLAAGDARTDRSEDVDHAEAVLRLARQLLGLWRRAQRVTALNVALSEAVEGLDRWNEAFRRYSGNRSGRKNWLRRLLFRLRRFVPWRRADRGDERAALLRRVQTLHRELEISKQDASEGDSDSLTERVAREVTDALGSAAARVTTPDSEARQRLSGCLQAFQFSGRTKPAQMTADEARLVLQHRPLWAVSSLSASSRIPLIPALFDYVIFDEASQCDIASALPLFARARHAVVVGDPMQLGFIPQLSLHQERTLMDVAELGPVARHSIAQSTNSLFDFVRGRDTAKWHFLADQFRSDPAIVAYLNAAFYEGRLVAARSGHRAPDGYKPGLSWHDVRGRPTREDGGNVNHAEADAIARLLTEMIRERGFRGSIGVLSPFNAQVALLLRRLQAVLTEAEIRDVRISTIDKFQGGEADVILFSLVVAAGVHQGALTFYERERRRLNVAISRARALCLVVGDKEFARKSRVSTLSFLAEVVDRPPRPRQQFDSEWERRLYTALERRGLQAFPQYPVGTRYLDLALDPEGRKLDVEVDGRQWHANPDGNRKTADLLRDRELIARGWTVRRFWVHELAENMEKCVDVIERDLGRA